MSSEMLRRLSRRELAPREIAEVLRHIGECGECARASAAGVEIQPATLESVTGGDEGPWHPDHAEIVSYVDGVAGPAEREIVASHVEDCELCREDVADLAALRRPRPRRRVWRTALATAAAIGAVVFILQRGGDQREPTHQPVVITRTATPKPPAQTPPRYANPEWEQLVRTAIESGRLPFARGIDATSDPLRGSGSTTLPDITPSGVVIDEVRPRFSWPAREGATFVVSIFSGEQRIAQSEPLTGRQWTPAVPLPRGRTYMWQVQATHRVEGQHIREIIPAPPAPPALFRIVSKRDHDELVLAKQLHPEDHLLHAVLAARAGLREEALHALARAHTNIRPDYD